MSEGETIKTIIRWSKKLLCFLGFHEWIYSPTIMRRFCVVCGRCEKQAYDMAYGETYYEWDRKESVE